MSRRETIRAAFEQAKGNAIEAAKILGVADPELRRWLAQDFVLTRELRARGFLAQPDKKQKYVQKTGIKTKLGETDETPLASRRLTIREERDAGIWVPLKEEKGT
jgi:hypothetical protein